MLDLNICASVNCNFFLKDTQIVPSLVREGMEGIEKTGMMTG